VCIHDRHTLDGILGTNTSFIILTSTTVPTTIAAALIPIDPSLTTENAPPPPLASVASDTGRNVPPPHSVLPLGQRSQNDVPTTQVTPGTTPSTPEELKTVAKAQKNASLDLKKRKLIDEANKQERHGHYIVPLITTGPERKPVILFDDDIVPARGNAEDGIE
jgi:hypothetical protein